MATPIIVHDFQYEVVTNEIVTTDWYHNWNELCCLILTVSISQIAMYCFYSITTNDIKHSVEKQCKKLQLTYLSGKKKRNGPLAYPFLINESSSLLTIRTRSNQLSCSFTYLNLFYFCVNLSVSYALAEITFSFYFIFYFEMIHFNGTNHFFAYTFSLGIVLVVSVLCILFVLRSSWSNDGYESGQSYYQAIWA